MYQAGELCVATAREVYDYAAAQCAPVSGGQAVSCLATDAGVSVTIGTQTTQIHPALVQCSDPLDTIALAWLVVGVLVIAWAWRAVGDTAK